MEEIMLFKKILEETEEGILVLDREGYILYANSTFKKVFSTPNEKGKRFNEIISHKPLSKAIEDASHSQGISSKEITLTGARDRDLKLRSIPFKDGMIWFFHDITEERRLEKIKRDFVSNVSHEMRTPLANIKGYTETLLDGALKDKKNLTGFLSVIDKHTTRMTHLIDDLLILSRLEAHEVPVSFSPVEIKEIISSALNSLEKQAESKRIALSCNCLKKQLNLEAEREGIEQILTNLIDNAIKYTPEGGKVSVSAYAIDGGVQVDVEDTGIGIPAKDIPRIFERFYRVDKARSRILGGTGLGLSIVKHIVLTHKGKVWVESEVGKGTKFSFTIPRRR
jgi:two-component system phosphate regulon sensor histidine kinase PhoR